MEKNKKKIVCFMGKSGSGKSTLISDFFNKYKDAIKLNVVKSFTTREVRKNDPEDINTHVFTNLEQYISDLNEDKIISRYYSTKGYRNWTTSDSFEDDSINLYAIDPIACNDLIEQYKDQFSILPIYVKTDEIIRIKRLLEREKGNKKYSDFIKEEEELELHNYTKGNARLIYTNNNREECVEILEYYIKDWLLHGSHF